MTGKFGTKSRHLTANLHTSSTIRERCLAPPSEGSTSGQIETGGIMGIVAKAVCRCWSYYVENACVETPEGLPW